VSDTAGDLRAGTKVYVPVRTGTKCTILKLHCAMKGGVRDLDVFKAASHLGFGVGVEVFGGLGSGAER